MLRVVSFTGEHIFEAGPELLGLLGLKPAKRAVSSLSELALVRDSCNQLNETIHNLLSLCLFLYIYGYCNLKKCIFGSSQVLSCALLFLFCPRVSMQVCRDSGHRELGSFCEAASSKKEAWAKFRKCFPMNCHIHILHDTGV